MTAPIPMSEPNPAEPPPQGEREGYINRRFIVFSRRKGNTIGIICYTPVGDTAKPTDRLFLPWHGDGPYCAPNAISEVNANLDIMMERPLFLGPCASGDPKTYYFYALNFFGKFRVKCNLLIRQMEHAAEVMPLNRGVFARLSPKNQTMVLQALAELAKDERYYEAKKLRVSLRRSQSVPREKVPASV